MSLEQSGAPAAISPRLIYNIVSSPTSTTGAIDTDRLMASAERASALLRKRATNGKQQQQQQQRELAVVEAIELRIGEAVAADGIVDVDTDYSYELSVNATDGKATVSAPSGGLRVVLVCCWLVPFALHAKRCWPTPP